MLLSVMDALGVCTSHAGTTASGREQSQFSLSLSLSLSHTQEPGHGRPFGSSLRGLTFCVLADQSDRSGAPSVELGVCYERPRNTDLGGPVCSTHYLLRARDLLAPLALFTLVAVQLPVARVHSVVAVASRPIRQGSAKRGFLKDLVRAGVRGALSPQRIPLPLSQGVHLWRGLYSKDFGTTSPFPTLWPCPAPPRRSRSGSPRA